MSDLSGANSSVELEAQARVGNWNIVEKFASSEDNTTRVLGMKFPREGYT